jgi:ATP-dependent DNA helicase RecG
VERQWNIDPKTSVPQALRQLKLLRNDQLTIAALLLFGREPQRFLVQAKLRCARFKGTDEAVFIDLKVIEGTIMQQVEEAMAFVQRHTSMAVKIEGKLERTETWEHPLEAVREAITNAVCHREYADSGNVVVKIFDDRLEVSNPGALPPGMTVEDLKQPHESKPRNKLVADAFFLIKYIEQFGTGIRRMIQDCHEAGVPEPEFESRAGAFRTVFPRLGAADRRLERLTDRHLQAVRHATEKGRITLADYALLVGMPKRTLQRDLQELVRQGLLVKRGTARATWYEVKK